MKLAFSAAMAILLLSASPVWGQCADLRVDPQPPVQSGTTAQLLYDEVTGADSYRLDIYDPFLELWATHSLASDDNSVRLHFTPLLTDATYKYRIHAMSGSTIVCSEEISVLIEGDDDLREELIRAVVPVAGSLPGAFESNWRTILSLANDTGEELSGKLVFHAAGMTISDDDPSIDYALEPGESVQYEDIVQQIGTTGLGSLDIVPDGVSSGAEDVTFPVIQVRVVNDVDENTTYGTPIYPIYPTAIAPETSGNELPANLIDPVANGVVSSFVIPPDYGSVRVNVGMRSFDIRDLYNSNPLDPPGAFVGFALTREGETIETEFVELPAGWMQQMPVEGLFDSAIQPGDLIISRGVAAIVYWTATDNQTNDPSFFIDVTSLNGQTVTPRRP